MPYDELAWHQWYEECVDVAWMWKMASNKTVKPNEKLGARLAARWETWETRASVSLSHMSPRWSQFCWPPTSWRKLVNLVWFSEIRSCYWPFTQIANCFSCSALLVMFLLFLLLCCCHVFIRPKQFVRWHIWTGCFSRKHWSHHAAPSLRFECVCVFAASPERAHDTIGAWSP